MKTSSALLLNLHYACLMLSVCHFKLILAVGVDLGFSARPPVIGRNFSAQPKQNFLEEIFLQVRFYRYKNAPTTYETTTLDRRRKFISLIVLLCSFIEELRLKTAKKKSLILQCDFQTKFYQMEEYAREPCPYRIVDDCGGAFAMGCIGGGVFQAIKGFRNAPSGLSRRFVSKFSQCDAIARP